MKATLRDVGNGVTIIKLEGKITIGAGDQQLRDPCVGSVHQRGPASDVPGVGVSAVIEQ